ncbi:MAG: rRNA maturation RNase YbeY [Pirellulaceae bacterium]
MNSHLSAPESVEDHMDDEEPPPSGSAIEVDLIVDADITSPLSVDEILQAVRTAANQQGFHDGSIGVRITNDPTIRQINAQHLGHDYATDVISFGYDADPPRIEGELVVSVDTANQKALEIGWPQKHEMLLYIVHGVLHITGMDDHEPSDRAAMRTAEENVFLYLGIQEISRCGADQPDEVDQ